MRTAKDPAKPAPLRQYPPGRDRQKGWEREVIFFDVETNGLSKDSSVLSISAIKAVFNGGDIETVKETFSRFYYRSPGEPENAFAIDVNGLTDTVIRQKRGKARYPKYFKDDEGFTVFCSGVRHFVGHNIAFDRKFLDFCLPHSFCTMRENTDIIRIKRWAKGFKYPRLKEAADFYRVETDEQRLHGSDYDTRLTYEIFKRMLKNELTRESVIRFLKKDGNEPPPKPSIIAQVRRT
jgi:DNA polymerase III epsilon subunit-like protein